MGSMAHCPGVDVYQETRHLMICLLCGQPTSLHTVKELCQCGLAKYWGNDLYVTDEYRRLISGKGASNQVKKTPKKTSK